MLTRIAVALMLGFVLAAPAASAQKAIDITPGYIVGIKLGMTQAKARALLTKPVRLDRLENGYLRFVSGAQKVEVYFKQGVRGVVTVTTWSKVLRTDEQVGPCSSVAALKRAYGAKLRPFREGGKIVAYRLGNLIFTAEGGRRVGVVALGRSTASVFVALSAPECR